MSGLELGSGLWLGKGLKHDIYGLVGRHTLQIEGDLPRLKVMPSARGALRCPSRVDLGGKVGSTAARAALGAVGDLRAASTELDKVRVRNERVGV